VVVVALLSGCGGTDTVLPARPGTTAGAQPGAVPGGDPPREIGGDWTVRRASERTLVVSLVASPPGDGPCGQRLAAVAEEDADVVRLSVVDDNGGDDDNGDGRSGGGGPVACTAVGHQWALPVTLERDLAGRTVVGGDGARVQLVDALTPARLPAGYERRTEAGHASAHSLTYLSPDGGWLSVTTWRDDDAARAEQVFTLVEHRRLDGRVYRLAENGMQRLVAFDVGARRVWVSWMRQRSDSPAPLDWEALLDVAASVG